MIHLAPGEVRAEAVTRVVQTQERVAGTGRGQERGEAVKTAGIVQEAVEDDPLLPLSRLNGLVSPMFSGNSAPGNRNADLGAGDPGHALNGRQSPPGDER